MSYEYLTLNELYDGAVTEIVMGPGPGNIICQGLIRELLSVLESTENDPNKKLLILAGEGSNYSYGASVEEHSPANVSKMLPEFHLLIEKMLGNKIPILSRVKGNCLGGGFEVAMASHYIFAEKNAKFAVPEIKLGVFPPPASILLPQFLGTHIASQFIISGVTRNAEFLQSFGLINKISEDADEIDEKVLNFIKKSILPLSASSIRFATIASRICVLDHYKKYIKEVESLYLDNLMESNDAKEGIQSFLDKKKPEWKNR